MTNWIVPFHRWTPTGNELAAVQGVLASDWLTRGAKCEEFEAAFAAHIGVKPEQVLAVSSCTAALELAAALIGTADNDTIYVSPLTFTATANAFRRFGARIKFVDVDDNTLCINPALLDRQHGAIVVAMHYGGYPCDMAELRKYCKEMEVPLIEDSAHAIEGEFRGRHCGTIGDFGCFSFHATKNITTGGEGGALVGGAEHIARARMLHSHGRKDGVPTEVGYNYRMTDVQAAIGVEQLAHIGEWEDLRDEIISHYAEAFDDAGIRRFPKSYPAASKVAPHIFAIRVSNRDKVQQYLTDAGVETRIHYPPLHLTPAYYTGQRLPVAEKAAGGLLSLPLYPRMTDEQVEYVIKAVKGAVAA